MFFYISKYLQFLYSPLSWVLILLILSFLFKKDRKRKIFLFVSIGLLFIFTNSFLATEYIRIIENSVPDTYDSTLTYDVAIVLGGGMVNYDAVDEKIHFHHNTDRYLQALRLLAQNKVKNLLITGGSGSIVYRNMKEACILRQFSAQMGIDTSRILVECESDNTYENAVRTKQLLQEHQIEGTYLLITSAHHMRRAAAVFRKQGFQFHTLATNPIAGKPRTDLYFYLIPSVNALLTWEIAIKETIGYIVYKIIGYA